MTDKFEAFRKFNTPPNIDIVEFTKFVAAQPPKQRYNYGNACECPLGRYLKSTGEKQFARNGMVLPEPLRAALNPPNPPSRDTATYGALLKRLEHRP